MRAAQQLIAGLMPPTHPERAGLAESLPLASPSWPAHDGALHYAIGRIDESGSVPAAYLFDALEWRAGDRVAITARRGVAVVQRDVNGQVAVSKRRTFVIPAAVRRACGIRTQDALFLAAAIEYGIVFVHSPAVVDEMVTLYHRSGNHG